MQFIDTFIDRTTMYRLLIYYLALLLGAAVILSAIGYISYNPLSIVASTTYLLAVCWLTNKLFAHVFEMPANPESPLITALILALIISPGISLHSIVFFTAASVLAIASKYLLTIRGKHIFNPAAFAVVVTSLAAGQSASWWVGNAFLMPLVVLGGILLVRKIKRGQMVVIYLLSSLGAMGVLSFLNSANVIEVLKNTVLHSSLFFLAFVMLTEPATSPGMVKPQRWYGALVGVLFPPQLHLGGLFSTPELALVIGNIFSYFVSSGVKLLLTVKRMAKIGTTSIDFLFVPSRRFTYLPGQYMEFTLPHQSMDSRGVRRYFTLASSPTEDTLRIGVRFYPEGSSFKKALRAIDSTTQIAAGQLGGDFILPKDPARKLAFIAGGIGITPFRSMLKYLIDTNDPRAVTLFYSERSVREFVYRDVLDMATEQSNRKVIYTVTGKNMVVPAGVNAGSVSSEMIQTELPDFRERLFYISGSQSMVNAMRTLLREMGVNEQDIKVDFFPGLA